MGCHLVGSKPLSESMLDRILSIGHLETNFSEILIEIYTYSFKKMHWKMAAILSRSQCANWDIHNVQVDVLNPPFLVNFEGPKGTESVTYLFNSISRKFVLKVIDLSADSTVFCWVTNGHQLVTLTAWEIWFDRIGKWVCAEQAVSHDLTHSWQGPWILDMFSAAVFLPLTYILVNVRPTQKLP